MRNVLKKICAGALLVLLAGCDPNPMKKEGHLKPLAPSEFFQNGQSARPLVKNTVAREFPYEDEAFTTGKAQNELVRRSPVPMSSGLLARGRERFGIFCTPCHGADGYGQGMIVQRGFTPPPSYHSAKVRGEPDGHFFDMISNGRGAMYSYAARITPEDRWAIVAYVRALQLSQYAKLEDAPEAERKKLLAEEPK